MCRGLQRDASELDLFYRLRTLYICRQEMLFRGHGGEIEVEHPSMVFW